MRTVQMELLRPGELKAEQQRISLVYLPIGPIEWHSYHMPMGTDGLAAQAMARMLAQKTGGVVAPTLFIGTERNDDPQMLENLNVPQGYTLGMDFAHNILPSMYFREEAFATVVREEVRLLVKMGYKLVVLVNGHGAAGQVATLKRVAEDVTHDTDAICLFPDFDEPRAWAVVQQTKLDGGHADRLETSLMMALTDSVDLSQLPPRETPLHSADFGIASGSQFAGQAPKDGVIPDDPRDATAEVGRALLEASVADQADAILKFYEERIGSSI